MARASSTGESIEHGRRQYWVHPPADPRRWARVAANIVRHYNQGWADGFEWNIRRWEIGNEPDCRPKCWTGTTTQYLELYREAVLAIKTVDPSLLVGGPALACNWELAREFLAYCRDHRLPLDFFSWHSYGDCPRKIMDKVYHGLQVLAEEGFGDVETHLTEWNRVTDFSLEPMAAREIYTHTTGIDGAASTAACLGYLQQTPLDRACYCSAVGGIGRICMFDRLCAPYKSFYAFKAFGAIADCGTLVTCTGDDIDHGLGIVGAIDTERQQAAVMLSNFAAPATSVELAVTGLGRSGPLSCREYVLDADRDLEFDREQTFATDTFRLVLPLPSPSVRLLSFTPR